MSFKRKILLRYKELSSLVSLLVGKLISYLIKENDLWLISERGTEARDNAFVFFSWLKINHPEINSKYIISKDSKDLHKIQKWASDIVYYKSWKHNIIIWKAKYLISTHVCGYTTFHSFISRIDGRYSIFRDKKKVFLQHGITKDYLRFLFNDRVNIDLFICGSAIEYRYIKENFGYPEGIVQYTGFCRYDNLMSYNTKRQLLVMPTFRSYINKDKFEESLYFQTYKRLLECNELHDILKDNGYKLVFYPHYEFQNKIALFRHLHLPPSIIIADMEYDVQQLLKESDILITDFSSVFFDMMYMNKPILFYQFDEDQYRAHHYQKGYLNYQHVGPVVKDLPNLVDCLKSIINHSLDMSMYSSYAGETFTLRDQKNCERVFNAIINC